MSRELDKQGFTTTQALALDTAVEALEATLEWSLRNLKTIRRHMLREWAEENLGESGWMIVFWADERKHEVITVSVVLTCPRGERVGSSSWNGRRVAIVDNQLTWREEYFSSPNLTQKMTTEFVIKEGKVPV